MAAYGSYPSDSPLVEAISLCCYPIQNYHISPCDRPLGSKKVTLVGAFSYSYSALRKLITAAGGTLTKNVTKDTDVLVYGFMDQFIDERVYYDFIEKAKTMSDQGKEIQIINELHLLKLCGVTFC